MEAKAFRYYGHFQGDNLSYFTEEERARNVARDPIDTFKKRVLERGLLSAEEMAGTETRVKKIIDEAVEFAESAPYPTVEEVMTDVYVSYP